MEGLFPSAAAAPRPKSRHASALQASEALSDGVGSVEEGTPEPMRREACSARHGRTLHHGRASAPAIPAETPAIVPLLSLPPPLFPVPFLFSRFPRFPFSFSPLPFPFFPSSTRKRRGEREYEREHLLSYFRSPPFLSRLFSPKTINRSSRSI
eukprot:scaffold286935_cov33-Tisochrysis_lutea.AAC.3